MSQCFSKNLEAQKLESSKKLNEASKKQCEPCKKLINEPTYEYQYYWRRIRRNIQEMIKFIENKFFLEANCKRNHNLEFLANQHKWSVLNDLDELREKDGYEKWRLSENANLSNLVQTRLHHLQNPPDCQKARKLVCRLRNCGFGCQIHHLVGNKFELF